MTDSKSVPFGGAGSNPANVLRVLVAQLADRPLHTRKAQGSIPCENCMVLFSRKVERSIRPENSFGLLRYGVVGNMSGFHPVASGSIPGSGCRLACIAQWQSGALVMLRSGIQSSVQAVSFFWLS